MDAPRHPLAVADPTYRGRRARRRRGRRPPLFVRPPQGRAFRLRRRPREREQRRGRRAGAAALTRFGRSLVPTSRNADVKPCKQIGTGNCTLWKMKAVHFTAAHDGSHMTPVRALRPARASAPSKQVVHACAPAYRRGLTENRTAIPGNPDEREGWPPCRRWHIQRWTPQRCRPATPPSGPASPAQRGCPWR